MKPFRPPSAGITWGIASLCVVVQLLQMLGGPWFRMLSVEAGLIPGRLTGYVIGFDDPLPPAATLVTYIFLHGGFVHLLMNMIFLIWAGRQVEWLLGKARYAVLFLAGGIAGGLLQVFVHPQSVVPVIGASGAISAVFATYALLFAQSGEEAGRFLGVHLSAETVRALRYAALWIGLQLLTAVAFPAGQAGGGIAIWCHIGGFLFGLLFGLPYLRRLGRHDLRL